MGLIDVNLIRLQPLALLPILFLHFRVRHSADLVLIRSLLGHIWIKIITGTLIILQLLHHSIAPVQIHIIIPGGHALALLLRPLCPAKPGLPPPGVHRRFVAPLNSIEPDRNLQLSRRTFPGRHKRAAFYNNIAGRIGPPKRVIRILNLQIQLHPGFLPHSHGLLGRAAPLRVLKRIPLRTGSRICPALHCRGVCVNGNILIQHLPGLGIRANPYRNGRHGLRGPKNRQRPSRHHCHHTNQNPYAPNITSPAPHNIQPPLPLTQLLVHSVSQ